MKKAHFSRRSFLSLMGASAGAMPLLTGPSWAQSQVWSGKTLILIELAGGNDGLNTVVPFSDDFYQAARPSLGLSRDDLITLDGETGLNSALPELAQSWGRGELKIVEGVGYPSPNRSHFTSIEIWNSANPQILEGQGAGAGWVSHALGHKVASADVEGLVLGGDVGPMKGEGRFTRLGDADDFVEQAAVLKGGQGMGRGGTSPLDFIETVFDQTSDTAKRLEGRLQRASRFTWEFPETQLGEQLANAARLLAAGVTVPAIKVVLDGFDTHEGQDYMHGALMAELDGALAQLRKVALDIGVWDQVAVMTYSEFGRTLQENGTAGTDHGTAAPLFVMGGNIRGGLAGRRPSLAPQDLLDGEPQYTTDFRSIYAGLAQHVWDVDLGGDRLSFA